MFIGCECLIACSLMAGMEDLFPHMGSTVCQPFHDKCRLHHFGWFGFKGNQPSVLIVNDIMILSFFLVIFLLLLQKVTLLKSLYQLFINH